LVVKDEKLEVYLEMVVRYLAMQRDLLWQHRFTQMAEQNRKKQFFIAPNKPAGTSNAFWGVVANILVDSPYLSAV
jgi:hypothetical protein